MGLRALADPPGLGRRLSGLVTGLAAFFVLFPALLVINVAQCASVALIPVSRPAFRGFNRWVASFWWGCCASFAQGVYGTRLEVTGDPVPPRENAIVVANHQEMADITYLFFFARSKGRLGDLKWFVKDVIKHVPGVGWGMVVLGCLFVKRDWTADRAYVMRTFDTLVRERLPAWLVTFAEGTRITPAKAARSAEYAARAGLPPTGRVLIPRTRGFVASVEGLGEHLDAVYDVTIGYPDGAPTLWQYVRGFSRVAHLHVRRTPREALPSGEAELREWLLALFRDKDRLLARFEETGTFPPSEQAEGGRATSAAA